MNRSSKEVFNVQAGLGRVAPLNRNHWGWKNFSQVEMMDGQTVRTPAVQEGGNGDNRAVWCCGMLWQFGQFAKLPTLAIRSLLVPRIRPVLRGFQVEERN